MVNKYTDIDKLLQDHGYFFNEEITVGNGGEVCTGLWLYTAPILHGKRLEEIKELISDEYVVDWFPNSQQIQIKLKK